MGIDRTKPPPGFDDRDLKPSHMLTMYMMKSWLRRARLVARKTKAKYIAWVEDDCELLNSFQQRSLFLQLARAGDKPLWAGYYPLKRGRPCWGSQLVAVFSRARMPAMQ